MFDVHGHAEAASRPWRAPRMAGQFIVDVQTHFGAGTIQSRTGLLGRQTKKNWNPASKENDLYRYKSRTTSRKCS